VLVRGRIRERRPTGSRHRRQKAADGDSGEAAGEASEFFKFRVLNSGGGAGRLRNYPPFVLEFPPLHERLEA